MSFIPGGGSNIFIAAGQTQFWVFTWGAGGWQGNTLIEPQPLGPGASLTCTPGDVHMSGASYAFDFSVTNSGPSGSIYDVQVSNN